MTKDQLAHFLAQKKQQKLLLSSTWSDLQNAIAGLSSQDKDEIALLVATGGGQSVVNKLQKVMATNAYNEAKTEADTALSDDNLTLAELNSLL